MRDIVERFRTEMRETLDASAEKSAEIKRLKAENEKLRAALQWYADQKRYEPHPHGLAFERRDLSYVARAALTQQEGDK